MKRILVLALSLVSSACMAAQSQIDKVETDRQSELQALRATYEKQVQSINNKASTRLKMLLPSLSEKEKSSDSGRLRDLIYSLDAESAKAGACRYTDFAMTGNWILRDRTFNGRDGFLILRLPEKFESITFKAEIESSNDFGFLLTEQGIDFKYGVDAYLGGGNNTRSSAHVTGNEIAESVVNKGMPPGKWPCELTYNGRTLKVLIDKKTFITCNAPFPNRGTPKFLCLFSGWGGVATVTDPVVEIR